MKYRWIGKGALMIKRVVYESGSEIPENLITDAMAAELGEGLVEVVVPRPAEVARKEKAAKK